MYRTILLVFLFLHMVCDFYLQTDTMANDKRTKYKAVLAHCGYYTLGFLLVAAACGSLPVIKTAIALALLHFTIDSIKYKLLQKHWKTVPHTDASDSQEEIDAYEACLYCLDQLFHFLTIVIAVYIVRLSSVSVNCFPYLYTINSVLPIELLTFLKWLCLITFLWKPAKFSVKQLLSQYKPSSDNHSTSQATIREFSGNPDNITVKLQISQAKISTTTDDSIANAGALIGILERIIIVLLLSVNQYAAIGLVLTAKSVARFEKLKKQSFAEYYLIGTLLSAMLVIAAYLFLFVIL